MFLEYPTVGPRARRPRKRIWPLTVACVSVRSNPSSSRSDLCVDEFLGKHTRLAAKEFLEGGRQHPRLLFEPRNQRGSRRACWTPNVSDPALNGTLSESRQVSSRCDSVVDVSCDTVVICAVFIAGPIRELRDMS